MRHMIASFWEPASPSVSSQVLSTVNKMNPCIAIDIHVLASHSFLLLSGMLSVSGKKVLHMDRNKYYGGDSASLTPLEDLFTKFGMPAPDQAQYGRGR